MARLKDKAITLLGTSASVSFQTGGPHAIFTTDPGKVTRITHVVIRDPTGSLDNSGGTTSYTINGFLTAFSLDHVTTSNTGVAVLTPGNTTQTLELGASTAVTLTINTGCSAASSAIIDVFGYTT